MRPEVALLARELASLPPKQMAALIKISAAKVDGVGVTLDAEEVQGLIEFLAPMQSKRDRPAR